MKIFKNVCNYSSFFFIFIFAFVLCSSTKISLHGVNQARGECECFTKPMQTYVFYQERENAKFISNPMHYTNFVSAPPVNRTVQPQIDAQQQLLPPLVYQLLSPSMFP
jgi:hypothetical protein